MPHTSLCQTCDPKCSCPQDGIVICCSRYTGTETHDQIIARVLAERGPEWETVAAVQYEDEQDRHLGTFRTCIPVGGMKGELKRLIHRRRTLGTETPEDTARRRLLAQRVALADPNCLFVACDPVLFALA